MKQPCIDINHFRSLFDASALNIRCVTHVVMTQALLGMGKATFTLVTGKLFVHFIALYILIDIRIQKNKQAKNIAI